MLKAEDLIETMQRISTVLSTLGIRYHFTGGIVSSFYGEPRLTQDIDVVADPARLQALLPSLLSVIKEGYLHTPEVIQSAVNTGSLFQLLDQASLIKIDIYPREMVPGELDRSVLTEILPGVRVSLASPIDAVLSKLFWIRKGSHKSRRDARAMIRHLSSQNLSALHESAAALQLHDILAQLQSTEEEID